MKCKFQTSHLKTCGEEVWSKLNQVEMGEVPRLSSQAGQRGKAYYISIQLYDGNTTYYPFVFIDIDSKDLKSSQITTQNIVRVLVDKGLSAGVDFSVAFSGSKGFHILICSKAIFGTVPDSELFPPKLQKAFVQELFREISPDMLEHLDDTIFGTHRMIRADYSINNKSGLNKVPLKIEELNADLSAILEMASAKQASGSNFYDKFEHCKGENLFLQNLFSRIPKVIEKGSVRFRSTDKGERILKKPKVQKSYQANAYVAYNSCRAMRQLGAEIITAGAANHDQRLALSSALNGTDLRDKLVHEILTRTEKYKQSLTQEKLDKVQFIGTCDILIEKKICKSPCSRYRTKNNIVSNNPGYLSKTSDRTDSWSYMVSAENI
jgi:hypothetical protein